MEGRTEAGEKKRHQQQQHQSHQGEEQAKPMNFGDGRLGSSVFFCKIYRRRFYNILHFSGLSIPFLPSRSLSPF